MTSGSTPGGNTRRINHFYAEVVMWQFKVDGMSCGHCEKAVRTAIQSMQANAVVTVDLQAGKVSVDAALLTPTQILAAIEDAGYQAKQTGENT